jgi:hypothetical protein
LKKSKPFLCILFVFIISCCFVGLAVAIPQKINYQAVLKNKASGQIMPDGNYTLTFRLYSVVTGGSALWTETATSTITNGILAHQLGSVTALNLAFDQNYYLGMQVAGDSEMVPREQLISLGYAFVAQNAEMVDGYNPGNSSGNIPLNNGTLNTNLNADKLDGQHQTFYQNASNLTTGTLSANRLRGLYSYTSTTVAHYAFNTDKLDGHDWSDITSIRYANVKIVAKSGGDYTSIQSAIDSLAPTGDGGGTTFVYVYAGKYYENITQKHVNLVGIPGNMGEHPIIYSTSRHIFDTGISGISFTNDTIFSDSIFAEITSTGWSPRITECWFSNTGFGIDTGIYVHGSVIFVNNETIFASIASRVTLMAIDSGMTDNVIHGCKGTLYGTNTSKEQVSRVFEISPTSRFMFSNNWYTMYNSFSYSVRTEAEYLSAIIYSGVGGNGTSNYEREILYNNFGLEFAVNTTNAVFIYTCSSSFNNISFNKFLIGSDSHPRETANTKYGGIWITGSQKRDTNGGGNIHIKLGGNIYSNNTGIFIPQYYGEETVFTFFQIDPIVTPSIQVYGNSTIFGKTYTQATGADYATSATNATNASNADTLDTQHGSFYQNASNLNSGILPAGRLVGAYSSASVAFADSAAAAGLTNISYSPYTISQPGSYIVVADLHTPQNVNCITIATSDVTLDLNGHTLYGAGTTAGSWGYGVFTENNNITVKNGMTRDFRSHGIFLDGFNYQVIQIRAYGNKIDGIWVTSAGLVKDNTVYKNGSAGIYAGPGCTVTGNSAYYNGNEGIKTGDGCTVIGNSVTYNQGIGINAENGCTVTGNSASDNGNSGIYTGYSCSVISNSVYNNNNDGINVNVCCTVTGNSVSSNTRNGIMTSTGCTIIQNSVYSNDSSGIQVTNGCNVNNNTSRTNSYAGIRATSSDNSISQNLVTYNTGYGLWSAAGNYFEQNKLRGNGINELLGGSTKGSGDLANVIF